MQDKTFLIGSCAFFNTYKDFHSKDKDYLKLIANPKEFTWRRELYLRGIDTFEYKLEPIAEMIRKTVNYGDAILLGKFLVPEIVNALGATIEDILPLESLLSKLDNSHKYLEVIFNAYKINRDFVLTDKLKDEAYKVYKEARKRK